MPDSLTDSLNEPTVTLGKTSRRVRSLTLGRLPKGLGRVRLKVFKFRDELEKAVLERSGTISKYQEARCQCRQPSTSKPPTFASIGSRRHGTR